MTKRLFKAQIEPLFERIERYLDAPERDLDGQLRAVREWIALADNDPETFDRIMARLPACTPDWLFNLPAELVDAGRVPEAQELAEVLDGMCAGTRSRAHLAVTLASRRDAAARPQIEMCRARFPDDPWVRLKCGEALALLGLLHAAEREFRRALSVAGDDEFTIDVARDRLLEFLARAGRADEARALSDAGSESCIAGVCESVRA